MLRFIKTGWYELSKSEIEVLIGFGLKDHNKISVSRYEISDLYKPNTVKDYNNELVNAINNKVIYLPPRNSILDAELKRFILKRDFTKKLLSILKEKITVNAKINEYKDIPTSRKNFKKLRNKFKKENNHTHNTKTTSIPFDNILKYDNDKDIKFFDIDERINLRDPHENILKYIK